MKLLNINKHYKTIHTKMLISVYYKIKINISISN